LTDNDPLHPKEFSFEREAELVRTIENLSEKLKILEDLEASKSSETNAADCRFMFSCYTAKHKMGTCPCELRR
jgi:hypothetical protein